MGFFTKKFRTFDPHLPIVWDKVLKKTFFLTPSPTTLVLIQIKDIQIYRCKYMLSTFISSYTDKNKYTDTNICCPHSLVLIQIKNIRIYRIPFSKFLHFIPINALMQIHTDIGSLSEKNTGLFGSFSQVSTWEKVPNNPKFLL